jgi:RNA polymerase sigma-54 factor
MDLSFGLLHGQTQNLKQNQRLMMSPQMQQAIYLLQVPVQELSAIIDAEVEQNPVLEYIQEEDLRIKSLEPDTREATDREESPNEELEFNDKDFEVLQHLGEEFNEHFEQSGNYVKTREDDQLKAFIESSIRFEESLFEYVMRQAQEVFDDKEYLRLAEILIGNFDERGFVTAPLVEIALLNGTEEKTLKKVLKTIQTFDPPGLGATSEQECLLIQLEIRGRKNALAYKIVDQCYEELLHNRIPVIKKSLGCSLEEIKNAIDKDIARLDIHPGTEYSQQVIHHIVPDVIVEQDEDDFKLVINDSTLPALRINNKYLRMLSDEGVPIETKEYITQKISSCKWLLKNIHQRNDTLSRIANSLLEHQKDFFTQSGGKLKPITMRLIAEELELHESTIARAVSNKYISCDRGVVSLRSFFTTAYTNTAGEEVSARTVQDLLLEIVKNEDRSKPLSDESISKMIQKQGIKCARRTVAKYRKILQIGNASQRKIYS